MSRETAMAVATGTPPPAAPAAPDAVVGPEAANAPAATPQAAAPTTSDPRMSALLKKEVALVNERQAFGRQKAEHEARLKQADTILNKGKLFEDTLSRDPVEALKLIGFSDTQIFNIMAESQKEKPTKTAEEIAKEETLKVLKERDEADAKRRSEQEMSANDRAVNSSIQEIVTRAENQEKFAHCAYHGEDAHEIIKDTLYGFAKQEAERNPGIVFDKQTSEALLLEATEAIERWYREGYKKMRSKFDPENPAPAAPEVVAAPEPAPTAQETRAKTLTNRIAPTTAAIQNQRETAEQKRSRLERVLATGDKSLLRL